MYTIPKKQLNPAPNPVPALPAPAGGAPAPPANFLLLTQAMTIQNLGRESAPWVEIVHNQKPDFFQLYPTLNYTESINATGQHTLRVESLASKEFFTIQFPSYTHAPQLAFIRSSAGPASSIPWAIVRKYPGWVNALMRLAMIIGIGFRAYWIIKGGAFVLRSAGW